ncbi:MAG TPA: hypothetical protein PLS90_07215 [Candidatus Sumerlaeota bacterium]|nr:hypothetical protein [Candidatus Sumerlaeota bacterium]HOR29406.1 hypothetical protein [Candidatus Sumerlaeota bacterium]HPK02233.1 hypothetical protein [Candidatus Sumerlaeota bacterium]
MGSPREEKPRRTPARRIDGDHRRTGRADEPSNPARSGNNRTASHVENPVRDEEDPRIKSKPGQPLHSKKEDMDHV